jgi:hypothetical protein
MQDSKERAAFTISKSLKDELEEVVPSVSDRGSSRRQQPTRFSGRQS